MIRTILSHMLDHGKRHIPALTLKTMLSCGRRLGVDNIQALGQDFTKAYIINNTQAHTTNNMKVNTLAITVVNTLATIQARLIEYMKETIQDILLGLYHLLLDGQQPSNKALQELMQGFILTKVQVYQLTVRATT